ncbi:MAG: hypothetical protein K2J80_12025 [Oscillospiraceae bacterium]|nr:hypothetical protein [Oscillospiraceae bacterium]
MAKKIFSIIMAVVTTATFLGGTALADVSTSDFSCSTYVSDRREDLREFTVKTIYKKGTVDIITAGIQCCRMDNGTNVGPGELISNKNSSVAVAYESVKYSDCSRAVRAFGSHSAYKNGQTVVFEFTQSKEAI